MIKKIKVTGMHCASCATGIETFLRSQEGIENAQVDFEENQLKIEYTGEAELDEAWKKIEDRGYAVEQ